VLPSQHCEARARPSRGRASAPFEGGIPPVMVPWCRWAHGGWCLPVLLLAQRAQLLARAENPALRGAVDYTVEQVLVFDAGSSGTRIHVFNLQPLVRGAHVPRIDLSVRDAQTKKVKPGLSNYAKEQTFEAAGRSIRQLLDFADEFVPAERRARTPALLKATAGLRSVGDQDAAAVLKSVRQALASSGYRFEDEWADIIKGKEEAGLAWVAANYLRGTFDDDLRAEGSLGVIEMGGGSTQVSFQVGGADTVAPDDSFVLTTATGREYRLYAHSYIGFGQDYAQMHLRERGPTSQAKDPCYPVGYHRNSGDSLVEGSGDRQACQQGIVERLFDGQEGAPGHYASELPLRGKFACTENFFYVRSNEALPISGGLASMDAQAGEICSRALVPTPEQAAIMDSGKEPDRPNSCFGLSYQVVLLQQLGAPTLPGVEVVIQRKINGGDIDWALGAALVHGLATFPRPGGLGPEDGAPAYYRVLAVLGMLAMVPLLRAALGPLIWKGRGAAPASKVATTVFGKVAGPAE